MRDVASGVLSPEVAAARVEAMRSSADARGFAVGDFANLDFQRDQRTGFPEVVWGPGKTPEQIAAIMSAMASQQRLVMATRISPQVYAQLAELLPGVTYHRAARICTLEAGASPYPPPAGEKGKGTNAQAPTAAVAQDLGQGNRGQAFAGDGEVRASRARIPGTICLIAAGTADFAVAEEARVTAELAGCKVNRITDVGVAGIHRLLSRVDEIRAADVAIVVAGMEGALPSVVAGLVDIPVIAVPTSIGYGAAMGGLTAMMANLTSCAPGVAVVNVDNGYGAAMVAIRMLSSCARMHQRSSDAESAA